MLNVGTARQLCEKLIRKPINAELFRELLNVKHREFASRTGTLSSSAIIASVADTQEYQLPADCLHVKDVIYDDYRANKMTHWEVQELLGQV